MEILALILLLTMSLIILTDCAKYSFKSSNNTVAYNSTSQISNQTVDSMVSNKGSSNYRHHLSSAINDVNSRYSDYYNLNNYQQSSFSLGQLKPTNSASSLSQQQNLFAQLAYQYSAMHLRWLSNSSVTCNDGTRAGYYIRPTLTGSRRWLIFLEGGWYCMSKMACDQRWYNMRDYMTSFRWSQYKTFSGILSPSPLINPYWWNANHVFIPYCSSDIWSGDSLGPSTEMAFLGSRIIDEVINELIRTPFYRFIDAKFVLLAGSSAGAAGVMINLDRVAQMISDAGSSADVRGLADSGWILDNDPAFLIEEKSSKISNNQQKLIPCVDSDTNCSPAETIKGAYKLWNSRVPEACARRFPSEPWRCYFGYRIYPTLNTPLFIVQFQYDEFQMYMNGISTVALNNIEKMKYIQSLADRLASTLANVSAVFAPTCVAHILLNKLDWHKVSIRGVTLPEALNCWEQTPVTNNRFVHYPHHHHHLHHHHEASFPFRNTNKFIWTPGLNSKSNKQKFNIDSGNLMKENAMYNNKPEYILAENSNSNIDQNELSQFYSTNPQINYQQTASHLKQFSSNNYGPLINFYSLPRFNSQAEKTADLQQKMTKMFWKLSNTNSSSTRFDQAINQTKIEQTSFNRKKKKRKGRKSHHRRKSSLPTVTTPSTITDSKHENIIGKSLNSYYQNMDANGNDYLKNLKQDSPISSYWSTSRNPYHYRHSHYHYSNLQMCQFRLIDDHKFPDRNSECPRLQFNQNNNNNQEKFFMERKR